MSQEITESEYYLPEEIQLDEYHPDNHIFMEDIKSIQRAIVAQSATMKPWHVEAVKLRMSKMTNKEIAVQLDHSDGGVSQALNSPSAVQLRKMLDHHATLLAGPNAALRNRILWEIVVDNQDDEPKVAISAIQEMNKMDGTYSAAGAPSEIKISINNHILPRGKLDE